MINRDSDIYLLANNFQKTEKVSSFCIQDFNNRESIPTITIVIPTYKRANLLKEAIDSALNQFDFADYEILIVDNNPERGDDTEMLLKKYAHHQIVYYKNQVNIGMFGNWNRCIELARTPYIVYLHDDDLLLPDTLKSLYDCLQLNDKNTAIIGRRSKMNDNHDIIDQYKGRKKILGGLFIEKPYYKLGKWNHFNLDFDTGCGALFNRDCLLRLGGFNADFYPQSDYILLLNYSIHYGLCRINKEIRRDRVAVNESFRVYKSYAIGNYAIKKQIIKRYFRNKKMMTKLAGIMYIANRYHVSTFYNNKSNLKKPYLCLLLNKLYSKVINISSYQPFNH